MGLLWISPSDWTAIGTMVLAVVTIVYVVLTWRVSERAAEAASKAAAAAEAALNVDLMATYFQSEYRDATSGETFGQQKMVQVFNIGATVYLHEVRVGTSQIRALNQRDPRVGRIVSGALRLTDLQIFGRPTRPTELQRSVEWPLLIHGGETVLFEWPSDFLDLSRNQWVYLIFEYSVAEEGPRRRITRTLEFPQQPPNLGKQPLP